MNSHNFPVPSDFQSNEATEGALFKLINKTTRGYIGLLGPPGTGKSTLLQRGLYSTPEYSVSRYLAFHPDQRHGLGRAEAEEFLNDLVVELISQGYQASRFKHENLLSLRTEFSQQLENASSRFLRTGRKTIIIIDGLDHVPQEENPSASFLRELPPANSVPEGVIFILGTQRLDLHELHRTIIQQTQEEGRTINVAPLTRRAVFALANASALPKHVDRGDLYRTCRGHPLTTRYFVEALSKSSSYEDAVRVLSHADGIGQDLQKIYERVWISLGVARSTRDVLGLLARTEGTISPEQLAEVFGDDAVEGILEKAGFLLARSSNGRISIFHNSFRLFIAAETGKKFGTTNFEIESNFQRQLAGIARSAQADNPQYWCALRYYSRVGDDVAVLELGSPEYFRRALQGFRPSDEVYGDLRLTYAAVRPSGDPVLLLNKLLIEKEIDYRLEAISNIDFVFRHRNF